VNPPTEAV